MILIKPLMRVISFATSLVGMVIVLAAISTQPAMSLFFGSIHSIIAWIVSLGVVYYANTIGYGVYYLIGFSLVCAGCGVIGSPNFLIQSLFQPSPPEPKVKMVKSTAQTKPKKGVAARMQQSIFRIPFRICMFIFAVLDTLLSTTILQTGAAKRSWIWDLLFEKKEQFYDYEEVYGGEVQNDHPDELWIHVNGILNTLSDGKTTCKFMTEMFGRPVKFLHNPTDGPVLDLLECMMGKTGLLKHGYTGPRKLLKETLEKEMKKGYKKIVIVAHSQGTIITGNVISDFNDIVDGVHGHTEKERETMKANLSKVEVYLVAGAAHLASGKYVSHLECISNRGDVVAVLGHLFPNILKPLWRNTRGRGIRYMNCIDHVENANWGHSLIAHYFEPMKNGYYPGSKLVTSYWMNNPQKKD